MPDAATVHARGDDEGRLHEPVGPFIQVAFRVFGDLARRRLDQHPSLSIKLLRSRSPLVPVAYLARTYFATLLVALAGLVPFVLVLVLGTQVEPRLLAAFILMPVVLGVMTYSYHLLKPDLTISARGRDLESNLPYALNFMAALASAGVVPKQIFQVLGVQEVYGEAAVEANLIARDTSLFSKDLVTALHDAARRAPSQQWEEFLQGAVNTITSGGELKKYLLGKAEQFSRENRRKQKGFLESLGVMAESYVVVAAAAPLFLIVIVSVMMLLQGGDAPVFFLNLIVLVALPLIHGGFTYILRTLRPE